jgi:tetratricopeptide (TPR) repeat protein
MAFSGPAAGGTSMNAASQFQHIATSFKSIAVSLRNAKAATTNAMVKAETIDAGLKDLVQQLEVVTAEISALGSDSSTHDFDALRALSAAIYNDSRSLLSCSLSSSGKSFAMTIRHVACRAMESVAWFHTPQALLQVVRCWVRVGMAWESANQYYEAKECFANAWSCVNSIGGPSKVGAFIMGLEAEQALRCLFDASIHKARVEWALFEFDLNGFHFAEESYVSALKAMEILAIIPTTTAADRFLIVDMCVACAAYFMENRRWAQATQWLRASLQGCEDCFTVVLDGDERGQVHNRRFRVLLALAFAQLEDRLANIAAAVVVAPDYFAESVRYLQLADANEALAEVPLQLYIRSRIDVATDNLAKAFQGIQTLIQAHAATASEGMGDDFPMVLNACAAFASASHLSDDAFTLYSVAAKTCKGKDRACALRVELISQMLLASDTQAPIADSGDRLAKFVSKVADDHITGKLPITNEKHVQRILSIVQQLFDRATAEQTHESALAWGLRALQLQSGCVNANPSQMFETCSRLSTIYFTVGDLIHAVEYAERALALHDTPMLRTFVLQLRIEEMSSAMRMQTLVDVASITAAIGHMAAHSDITFVDKMVLLSSVLDAVKSNTSPMSVTLTDTVVDAGIRACNTILRTELKKMEHEHECAILQPCLFAARHFAMSSEAATISAPRLSEFLDIFHLYAEQAPKCHLVAGWGDFELSAPQLTSGVHAALALFMDLAKNATDSNTRCKAWLCTSWLAYIGVLLSHRAADAELGDSLEVYADIACIAHAQASWNSMIGSVSEVVVACVRHSLTALLDALEQTNRFFPNPSTNCSRSSDLCILRQAAILELRRTHGCFVHEQGQPAMSSLLSRVPLLEMQSLLQEKYCCPTHSFPDHVDSVISSLISKASFVCLHPRHLEWFALHLIAGSNSDPVVARSVSTRALEAISSSNFGLRQYSMPTAAKLCRLLVSTSPTKTEIASVLERIRTFVHTSLMILGSSSPFQTDMLFPPEELDYIVCTAWNHGVFFWQTEVTEQASKFLSWAINMLAPLQSLCLCHQAASSSISGVGADLVALTAEPTMRMQYTAFLAASKLPVASSSVLTRTSQVAHTSNRVETSQALDTQIAPAWRNEVRLSSTPQGARSKWTCMDLHSAAASSISSFRQETPASAEVAVQDANSVAAISLHQPSAECMAEAEDVTMRTIPPGNEPQSEANSVALSADYTDVESVGDIILVGNST